MRFLIALFVTLAVSGVAATRPNIILLLADDLGWTGLGCYGNTLHETPNLDRLAKEGMRFTDAYAACTVCSPTRASLMTGKYPARLHVTDFITGQNRPFEKTTIPEWTKYLSPREETIAEALRAESYATAHIGKWHLAAKEQVEGFKAEDLEPRGQGFDSSIDKPAKSRGYFLPKDFGRTDGSKGGFVTDYLTDEALKIIRTERSEPFFLYLAYHNPHTPIQGKAELVAHYEKKLAARPDIKIRNATYAAMIHSLDQSVGRIVAAVDDLGIAENTLILFVSDNGGLTQRYGKIDNIADNTPLRRGKGSAYEGGVRVPMIGRQPGVIPAGTICGTPVMTIDFFPTAMEFAGSKRAVAVDGQSLHALLKKPAAKLRRDALYWHYPHYHAGGDAPYTAIRKGNWRFVDFHDDTPDALFNLSSDIGETKNLAAKKSDLSRTLHNQLRGWRTKVNAQMPAANPAHDPSKAGTALKRKR
ncbi:MAG: arylsulfatase A [Limisphaerales bacterium]|jgi:arylsulfatase A